MGPLRHRTIHFASLGCPKNRVDTEVMAGIAAARGLAVVFDAAEADVIVVNTCAFIERAREESVAVLLEMARHRTAGRCRLLVAAGCLAQRYAADLAEELPELAHVMGTTAPDRLGEVLDGGAPRLLVGPAGHFLPSAGTPRFLEERAASAYVKIGDGCSRRCAFCAIPAIRGAARSRPIRDIADEARRLAERGVAELNLVAQDTSAYGRDLGDGTDLAGLIRALDRVDGIRWVRLLYLYPDAVDDALLEAIGASEKTVRYLDVPIQHASGPMLRRMRRGHGPAALRRLVERARRILPDAVLRTTVLLGHPGETEDDFAALLAFVEWAGFDHLGAFRYSEEEGTAAARALPKVPRRVAYDRERKLMALQRRISRRLKRGWIGREADVLIEGAADEAGYVWEGRIAGQASEIDGVTYVVSCSASPGAFVRGRIVRTGDHDLVVEPCEPAETSPQRAVLG